MVLVEDTPVCWYWSCIQVTVHGLQHLGPFVLRERKDLYFLIVFVGELDDRTPSLHGALVRRPLYFCIARGRTTRWNPRVTQVVAGDQGEGVLKAQERMAPLGLYQGATAFEQLFRVGQLLLGEQLRHVGLVYDEELDIRCLWSYLPFVYALSLPQEVALEDASGVLSEDGLARVGYSREDQAPLLQTLVSGQEDLGDCPAYGVVSLVWPS